MFDLAHGDGIGKDHVHGRQCLHVGEGKQELLKRLRDSGLPKLWVPRKENFFAVPALPYLGSGKLDLKRVNETAQRLATAQPTTTVE